MHFDVKIVTDDEKEDSPIHRDFSRQPKRHHMTSPFESAASVFLTQGPRTRACGAGTDTDRTQTAQGTSTVVAPNVKGPFESREALKGVFTPVFMRTAAAPLGPPPIARTTKEPITVRYGMPLRTAVGMDLGKAGMAPVCRTLVSTI